MDHDNHKHSHACQHGHDHAHGQEHTHGHAHTHSTPHTGDMGRIFFLATLLNVGVIALEVFFGWQAGSLALLADAGHNASDVMGLLLAWGAMSLSRRKASRRYTYGLQSASIMAALMNALLLLVAVGGIAWEALQRFNEPQPQASTTVMLVAAVSALLNGLTAMFLHKGHTHDLNVRGAYLHMLADTGISIGVVLSGAVIMNTGWLWLDPTVSLLISVMIIVSGWRLLRDSVNLSLHAVPASIDIDHVRQYLKEQQGVAQVHDLHIWAMSTTSIALSAHLLMPFGHPGDRFLHHLTHELEERYGISHVTVQIETSSTADNCSQLQHAQ